MSSPSYTQPAPSPPPLAYVQPTGTQTQTSLPTIAQTGAPDTTTYVTYGVTSDVMQAYRTLLAWGLLLSVIYLIGKTRAGYAAIYYSEVLILLFLFATQAQFFREKLTPITQLTQPTGS